jgi:hypothetical protein
VIDQIVLEGNQEFLKLAGIPDTPDGYGAAAAIDFDGPGPHMFTSDGSLIDSAGDVSNGTIFLARQNAPETQRAITILGVTGLMRSWKWRDTRWLQ